MTAGEVPEVLGRAEDPALALDKAPCGFATTDLDGLLLTVNRRLLELVGYEREELTGKRIADLLSRGGQIWYATHYAPMLQLRGSAEEIALELVARDGTRVPVLMNAVVDEAEGRPPVVRTVVFPASQRRSYERELLDSKERAEASEVKAIRLARTLQETLIPPTPPRIPGIDVAAGYRPAGDGTEVGGDFYDIFQVSTGDWVVTMGDVCGKGVEAAVVTALIRYTLRAAAVDHASPSEALSVLNQVMLSHGSDRFCTVVVLRLRLEDGVLRCVVSTGGHPLPLLRAADGKVREVGVPGTLVGVVPDPDFHDDEVLLQPGETLVAFTDGVIEARSPKQMYGGQRLAELVAAEHDGVEGLVQDLLTDVIDFQDGFPRDDVAVVGIRVPD